MSMFDIGYVLGFTCIYGELELKDTASVQK